MQAAVLTRQWIFVLWVACVWVFPADAATEHSSEKPVRVFILAGQSNMCGHAVVSLDHEKYYNGGRGNLRNVMSLPRNVDRMKHLTDTDKQWTVRDDVFVWHQTAKELKTGPLTVGFSSYEGEKEHFGPELQFGHVVGDAFEEPVLLIKTAWGGKSLHVDFRPPSAGGETGPYYRKMIAEIDAALGQAGEKIPELKGSQWVLSGVVWQQGWNDMIDSEATAEYTQNLGHLISDLRKHFHDDDLPFVIGELGNGGSNDISQKMKRFRRAQSQVMGLGMKNVRFVPTAQFARPANESPNQGHLHHWFGNAESYFMVGDVLGREMIAIIQQPTLPKVLILGDSISMGYTPFVRDQLRGKAHVFRPMLTHRNAENCAGTDKGITEIDRWLKIDGGGWDVIHFNFGLHDLKRVQPNGKNSNNPNDAYQSDPGDYEKQLRSIVAKLKQTNAQLILATTTPVPAGDRPVRPFRSPDDPIIYNRVAEKVASDNGIPVNDLFEFALPKLADIQQPNNVHFTKQGSELLGQQVAKVIERALGSNHGSDQ